MGFNRAENTWDLIVRYAGSLDPIRDELNITVVELLLRETVSTQCILPLCIKTVVKRECIYLCMYSLYL